jgi:DNA-binding IscR family transcriptional regulator
MRQVIEAIDGPIHLNLCLISPRACGRSRGCPAHRVWEEAQRAMLGVLSRAIIAEMALLPSGQLAACAASSFAQLKATRR